SFTIATLIPRPLSPPLFPYTTLFRSKASTASMVEGMFAPSATQITPFLISVFASSPFSSFWVAHGSATSTGTCQGVAPATNLARSEEHTSELQSRENLVCRLLLEKKK